MHKLNRLIDRLIDWMKNAALALIVFIALSVIAEVVLLNFLDKPVDWVSEVTEYALVYITFLSAVWILKEDGHVRVDFLLNWFPPKIQAMFEVLVSLIGIFISAVILIFGSMVILDLSIKGLRTETILAVPKAPLFAVIPFGCLLLLLQFVKRTVYWLNQWKGLAIKGEQYLDS